MEKYKVKKEDLIGDIKNFPIEVVQKMVDHQVEQENEANVNVFQEFSPAGYFKSGFIWSQTVEGESFWDNVICNERFDLFFEKYPKKQ